MKKFEPQHVYLMKSNMRYILKDDLHRPFFFPIDNDDDAIIYFALFSVNAANWSNGICQESRMGNSCACCSNTTGQENQRGGIC